MQLDLYTNWPAFVYGKTRVNHIKPDREVTPHSRTRGAQYLIISRLPPRAGLPLADVGMPANPVQIHSSLGDEFASLPLDLGGRFFGSRTDAKIERASGPGNWTALIWDLIDAASTAAYNSVALGAQPRDKGHVLLNRSGFCYPDVRSVRDFLSEVDNGADPAGEWNQDEGEPSGFGVIMVFTETDR